MKFSVGEIAVYQNLMPEYAHQNGEEVEVMAVGPFPPGSSTGGPPHNRRPSIHWTDYHIRERNGEEWLVPERCLRKRPQPGIPLEILRVFSEPQDNPDKVGVVA